MQAPASPIECSFRVGYKYQVHFTDQVFAAGNPLLRDLLASPARKSKALVVMDKGLAAAQPGLAREIESYFAFGAGGADLVCPPFVVEGGERAKNSYFQVSEIQSRVDRHHLDRHSYLLAVGGGALLDVAGLAAATAHRGLRHIRLPSTTLAQCDSGVGVKNGINAFDKKNFIGTFAPPWAVVNDFHLLASLGERERRAGLVEAVKVALIRDEALFGWLEANADGLARFEPEAVRQAIRRSAELHVAHIAGGGDPFENGSARPLDFGHWAAHKLEPLSEFKISHGEAVAIGVALDSIYSRNMRLLEEAAMERILVLLERLGFDLFADELLNQEAGHQLVVLGGLEEFREHLGGELTITLLAGIGRGIEVHEVSLPNMRDAMMELRERQERRAKRVLAANG